MLGSSLRLRRTGLGMKVEGTTANSKDPMILEEDNATPTLSLAWSLLDLGCVWVEVVLAR